MSYILSENTLRDFKKGNISAFKEICSLYGKKLFYFINAYTNNREVTEEIVQDVFIKLWYVKEKIDTSLSINSYIYTIAKNLSIDYLRMQRFKVFSIDSIVERELSHNNEGEEIINYEEENNLIRQAIMNLSPRKKEVFTLHRFERLTYHEIAQRLGISVSAVEKNISASLQDIRKYISKKSS